MLMCVCLFIFRFRSAHLMSCVADDDEEYIFPCRPAQQKRITQKNLNSFYTQLLDAAHQEGVIRKFCRAIMPGPKARDIDISDLNLEVSFQL